jgi:uncharacterized protein YqgV (UPF0045/DUF77 family)
MLVEFRISSMRQPPLGKDLARGVETLDRPRFESQPGSMSGCFEGSWDQMMSVIRGCHEALVDDQPVLVTMIVVDHLNGQNNRSPPRLKEHISAIAPQILNAGQQTRFIPVDLPQSRL